MTDAMSAGDDDPFDEDDIPWADSRIRTDYEAALGRFILGFNDLDRYVSLLIERIVIYLGDTPQLRGLRRGSFWERLCNLHMISAMRPELRIQGLPFEEMKELNNHRNVVAHGHFEQNPYQGDYVLITNKKTHDDFSTDRLIALTADLERVSNRIKAHYWFFDVDHEAPKDAAADANTR